jgi:hypothetical protein
VTLAATWPSPHSAQHISSSLTSEGMPKVLKPEGRKQHGNCAV